MEVASNLQSALSAAGYETVSQAALEFAVDRRTVHRWLKGDVEDMRGSSAKRIKEALAARGLSVTTDQILGLEPLVIEEGGA